MKKKWDVSLRLKSGTKTVRVEAETNFDAKSEAVMKEFGHMFTGLFKQMTAVQVK